MLIGTTKRVEIELSVKEALELEKEINMLRTHTDFQIEKSDIPSLAALGEALASNSTVTD